MIREKIRERYINYSLVKKTGYMIFLLIILPLLFLGVGLSAYMVRLNSMSFYRDNYKNLERAAEAVEEIFTEINDLRWNCTFSYSLRRIMKGRGTKSDYMEVKDMLNRTAVRRSLYENLSILKEDDILIQTGTYLIGIDEQLLSDTERYFRENDNICGYVDAPVILSFFQNSTEEGIKVNYSGLIDEYYLPETVVDSRLLNVTMKEDGLCAVYRNHLDTRSKESFLMKENGKVISATEKNRIGNVFEETGKHTFSDNRRQGSFLSGGEIWLYQYCEKMGGFLFVGFSVYSFYTGVFIVGMVVLMAILLCIGFALSYNYMQRKHIIVPLFQLKEDFEKLQSGDLEQIDFENRMDEIGVLQRSYNEMIVRLQELIDKVYNAEIQKKEAELKALTSQINPHFLYNTLDSIHWEAIMNKDGEVADQILALSDVYRYVLSHGREYITFQEEIDFQKRYMYLMKKRYVDRVTWEYTIEKGLERKHIPKLIIQPLIENAIIHGIEPLVRGGVVTLEIRKQQENILIHISDTGMGFPEDTIMSNNEIEQLSGSFALKNINRRLSRYYPREYLFEIRSIRKEGCDVRILIPDKEGKENENDDR